LIYREMPAVWDPSFRPRFYATWGRESAVVYARARRVEYQEYEQLLSIKAAIRGTEHYFVDGQRLDVDDDTFLILNAGRRYASRIDALAPVQSFSIFFERSLVAEVFTALVMPNESLLDNPHDARCWSDFDERLREHDGVVTPILNSIRQSLDDGMGDPLWLDEQLRLLLAGMLRAEHAQRGRSELVSSSKPATRRELHRRLGLAESYIHTFYKERIGLKDMAAAAHLSAFHFLRLFKRVHGVTPSVYLNRKRTLAAQRLIRHSTWTMIEIAEHVGFGSRTSLFRHLKAFGGVPPRELRGRPATPEDATGLT
jgi:AraC family transcriptional regulator